MNNNHTHFSLHLDYPYLSIDDIDEKSLDDKEQ